MNFRSREKAIEMVRRAMTPDCGRQTKVYYVFGAGSPVFELASFVQVPDPFVTSAAL
jgi:hypothetical protein